MIRREGKRRQVNWKTAICLGTALLAMAIAGCFGADDGLEQTGSDAYPGTELSEATQALHEAGLIDPYAGVEPTGEVKEFNLWVDHNVALEPFEGREMWAVGFTDDPNEPATIPGPEIRVTQGDLVRVHFHDAHVDEPHSIHWHGYHVPWEYDGVLFVTQEGSWGEEGTFTFTYEFIAGQAGTYWYHCAFLNPLHVDGGMFGAFIVEPQEGPEYPYDREETLIFHEMDSQLFSASGWALNPNMHPDPDALPNHPFDAVDSAKNQAYFLSDFAGILVGEETGEYLWAEGPRDYHPFWSLRYQPHYDTFMINGLSYPNTDPIYIGEGETLKLRMINAGQQHKSIHLHGHHFLITHNDGYPLANPEWQDTFSLAPGERVDALVQGVNPGIWMMHDNSVVSSSGSTMTNDYAFPGGMMTKLVYEGFGQEMGIPEPSGAMTAGDWAALTAGHHGHQTEAHQ